MMSKKTTILNITMVICATLFIYHAAEQFYIWAAIREFGYYAKTIPAITVHSLLGFSLAYPLVMGHVKSIMEDIENAHDAGYEVGHAVGYSETKERYKAIMAAQKEEAKKKHRGRRR